MLSKKSKNSLENSRSLAELRGIFSFTEVKSEKRLPKVQSGALRGYTSRNSTTSEEFLKRNLSPKEISKTTKDLFLRIEEKTRLYYSFRDFQSNPKSLQKNAFICKDIETFRESVLGKKNNFNKIHNELRKKREVLANLINKLEELTIQGTFKPDSVILNEKTLECEELESGLINEKTYKESLKHMINRIKSENLTAALPLIDIRKKISDLKQETCILAKLNLQLTSATSEINCKYEKDLETWNTMKVSYSRNKAEKTQIIESRVRLQLSVNQEKERNFLQIKTANYNDRLKRLENKLNEYQKVESLEDEIASFEKFCESQQEKFITIQKVTNVANVEEILNHFQFLMDNKKKLFNHVNNSLLQIEKLHVLMNALRDELEELRFKENENNGFLNQDLENSKKKLENQDKNIQVYDSRLENIEMIIVQAINTFTKVSSKLGVDKNFTRLRRENLNDCIKACLSGFSMIQEKNKIQEENSSSESSDLSFSDYHLDSHKF